MEIRTGKRPKTLSGDEDAVDVMSLEPGVNNLRLILNSIVRVRCVFYKVTAAHELFEQVA